MANDVRIKIQDYEGVLAAMEHEVRFIMFFVAREATEDALIRL
jgi:hypothetical protein